MSLCTLVDLYVPATAAPFGAVAEAAARAGLDCVVWVADGPEALPPASAAASEDRNRAALHGALAVGGEGYRMLLLAPRAKLAKLYAAVAGLDAPAAISAAARAVGGVAVAVSPRQGEGGSVAREPAPLDDDCQAGMIVQVCESTHFGRDLDLEDAGALSRRILGATGPFGTLDDVGRYATYVPGDARDIDDLIAMLAKGSGVAVEMGGKAPAPSAAGDEPPRRSGRGRRRSPRRRSGGGGGDE
jgi:hypothetical protein